MNNLPSNHKNDVAESFSKEKAYSLILNNTGESFLLINKDLKIVATNTYTKDQVDELLGIKIIPGMSILKLAPESRHTSLIELYNDVFKGSDRSSIVEMNGDHSKKYFEVSYKPARNEKGEIEAVLVTSRNITNNKKAEDALKEIEERWRFAIEGTNQGVWDWNMITNETIYSGSYKKMYGFADDELDNHIAEWESRVHPGDLERMKDSIREHSNSSKPIFESTYRIKNKVGNFKWVLARGMIINRDSSGKPVRMIGTHTDITNQVIAEENYKLLFYSNPLPMWTYDAVSLKFKDVNDAAINHYGYSREEFLSMTIKDIRPLDNVPDLIDTLKKRVATQTYSEIWCHRKKNGELIQCDISTYLLEKENEKTILVLSNDITDILKAQNELIKSNTRFSYAAKAASEALWEWDIEADTVYLSDAFTEILGWKVSERKAFNEWYDYIHPKEKNEIIESFNTALKDPLTEIWTKEYRYKKFDDSYAYILDKAIILRNNEGKAIKVIGAMQDISERKNLEQELLKNELERQKAINQATIDTQEQERSEIGKELHDNVNQVLTTTKLYLDLALSNPELKDELIQKSTKNIIGVINEIRQLSRSLMDPSIGDLGLIDSINDLIENINLTRKLHVRLSADKKIETLLNKNQKLTVFRIIQEALNNAIKHAKASTVSIQFNLAKDFLEIIIEDDGVGFHPDHIKKGAGLKNIQNRIYLINGSHSIQSAPEKGCKILINFPIH